MELNRGFFSSTQASKDAEGESGDNVDDDNDDVTVDDDIDDVTEQPSSQSFPKLFWFLVVKTFQNFDKIVFLFLEKKTFLSLILKIQKQNTL